MDASQVTEAALPVGEAFRKLVEFTGESPQALTRTLYESHAVATTWWVFAAVGVVAAALIWTYGLWIRRLAEREDHAHTGTAPGGAT
jgi:hypothetical protein